MARTALYRNVLNRNAADLAQLEQRVVNTVLASPVLVNRIETTVKAPVFLPALADALLNLWNFGSPPWSADFVDKEHFEQAAAELRAASATAQQTANEALTGATSANTRIDALLLPETIDEQGVRYLLTGAILGTYLNQIYEPIRSEADLHSALQVLGIPRATVESVIKQADRLWKSAALKDNSETE